MSTSTSTTTHADAPVTPIKPESKSTSRTETIRTEARTTSAKPGPRRASSNPPQQSTSTSIRTTDQTAASPDEVARVLDESAPVLRAAKQEPHIDDLSDLEVGSVNKAIAVHVGLAKRFKEEKTISKSELAAHKVTIELIRSALDLVETAIQDGDRETLASANGYTDMQVGEIIQGTKAFFAEETQTLARLNQRADNTDSRLTRVERLVLLKVHWWMPLISLIAGFIVWALIASHTWSSTITLASKQKVTIHSPADNWWFALASGLAAAIIVFALCVLFTRKGEVRTTAETEHDTYVVMSSSPERPTNTSTRALPRTDAGVTQTSA